MKKYILIILIILMMFLGSNKVNALEESFMIKERLEGISYLKYDGTYYYFMNAHAIRNARTGNIAYCIDPFSALVEGSSYISSSDYNSVFHLSFSQWSRIRLLAYYGYGYLGHTDEKWISITQMMIWKTVFPDKTFEWIDNTNDRNIIHPYRIEMEEMEALIKHHNTVSNFGISKVSTGKVTKILDKRHVIHEFQIVESTVDAVIDGDYLVVSPTEVGEQKVVFSREYNLGNNKMEFFYGHGTQSVVERGTLEPTKVQYRFSTEAGSIQIHKIDHDKGSCVSSGQASLSGAEYEVFRSSGELVGVITIDENCYGSLENLPYDGYVIREKKAGIGYYVDSEEYPVNIDSRQLHHELTLENQVIQSKVKIVKYYGNHQEYQASTMKPESGVVFEFYDTVGNLIYTGTTDESGVLEVVLPYGKYVVKQITTTSNYEKVSDVDLIIDENSNVEIALALYDLEIDVPNASMDEEVSFYDYILLFIQYLFLGGASFVARF